MVGYYPDKDVAVLYIGAPADKLTPIMVGKSADLQVGQSAFAIGNPFGLDQTLTTGVVSAVGREIESVTKRPIKNVIQTDASINPGNSGGPLAGHAGRLIGMNTAIYSPSGTSAGIGFAIPVDEINRVAPEIIARRRGTSRTPAGRGVCTGSSDCQAVKHDGRVDLNVDPDGPADKAGLRPTTRDENGDVQFGDLITAVDGKPIQKMSDLDAALDTHKIGDTVTVTVEARRQETGCEGDAGRRGATEKNHETRKKSEIGFVIFLVLRGSWFVAYSSPDGVRTGNAAPPCAPPAHSSPDPESRCAARRPLPASAPRRG